MILHNLDLHFLAKLDNLLKNSGVPCCSSLLIVNNSPAKGKPTSFNFDHSSRRLPHLDHFCLCQRRRGGCGALTGVKGGNLLMQNKYFEPQWLTRVTYLPRVVNNDGSRDNKPGEIPNLIIFCIVPAIRVENACVNTFKQDLESLVRVFTSTAWLVQAQREIRRGTNPGCDNPITHLKSYFYTIFLVLSVHSPFSGRRFLHFLLGAVRRRLM